MLALAVCSLGVVAPSAAQAGDRAFYVAFADVSVNAPAAAAQRDAFLIALLACEREPLERCRATRTPGSDLDTDGHVVLVALGAAATPAVLADAVRGSSAARRTLAGVLAAQDTGLDGIVLFAWDATRGATVTVLDARGRRIGAARLRPRPYATPIALDWAPVVRRVLAPIARRFRP